MEGTMNILVFGQLTDITKGSAISIGKANDTEALLEMLYHHYPLLKQKEFLIAVDKIIVNEKSEIRENAQIALLPPFSGG